jgi:nucleotide-binding universal stress UspA family protein
MMQFRRLLVPHDLSAPANRALKSAAELAGPDGELLVLHVVTPLVAPTGELFAGAVALPITELARDARRRLERVVARLVGPRGPKATVKVVTGLPHQQIVAHARGMDAIVMSTLGRTGLAHLVMGSVAEKTVRYSPIPVLTIRPRAARHAGRTVAPAEHRAAN